MISSPDLSVSFMCIVTVKTQWDLDEFRLNLVSAVCLFSILLFDIYFLLLFVNNVSILLFVITFVMIIVY